MSSNPVDGRTKICQLKDLILTLFGIIFRRIIYNVNDARATLSVSLIFFVFYYFGLNKSVLSLDPVPSYLMYVYAKEDGKTETNDEMIQSSPC